MKRRFAGISIVVVLGVCGALLALTGAAGAAAPVLSMGTATNASYTTVEVTGEINAEGEETFWNFQVSSDGGNTWQGTNVGGESTGAAPEPISGTVEEAEGVPLRPGTFYEVRLQAVRTTNGFEEFFSANGAGFTTLTLPAQTATIEPVTGQSATTAHFVGHVNPNAPAGDPSASTVHWHFHCEPIACPVAETQDGAEGQEPVAPGSSEVEVQADATGLEPNFEYHVSLITTNNGGSEVVAGPVDFITGSSAPSAETIPAFALAGGTQAQIGGRVNPQNSPTTWWVEWGPTASYGSSTPHTESAGSGGAEVIEAKQIGGLSPATTYHYQVVADNGTGRVEGGDMTFKTPQLAAHERTGNECPNAELRTGPSAALHECRAYELVTTLDLLGSSASIPSSPTHALPWRAVSTDGERVIWQTSAQLPGFDATGGATLFLSGRTSSGWTSSFASPPGSKIQNPGDGLDFEYVTPDLKKVIYSLRGATLAPSDPDPSHWGLYETKADGTWSWLTSPLPGVPSSTAGRALLGWSKDASAIYLVTDQGTIYRRVGDSAGLVSRDEAGVPITIAEQAFVQGVSDDGSESLFTSSRGLYLYEASQPTNIKIAADPSATGRLSSDGSTVIVRTTEQLTPDDIDHSFDLYEYDIATKQYRRLSAPTGAPASGPGNRDDCPTQIEGLKAQGLEPESCQVAEVAVADEARSVYFISPEQLDGDRGIPDQANMYLARGGVTRYITTLGPADELWNRIDVSLFSEIGRRVQPIANGSRLLFESRRRLTAYDNAGHLAIYSYDQEEGELTCVSCRPTGIPPTGDSNLRRPADVRGSQFLLPGDTERPDNSDLHGAHIYFESADAIAPGDTNGLYDTYEFDTSSAEPALISDGTSGADSPYLGTSQDGRDIFFFTVANLTADGNNRGAFKIYDARRDGGFAEPTEDVRCVGEGCRQRPSPGSSGSPPPTAQLVGPDDASERASQMKLALRACKKKKTAKIRKKCLTRVRHRYESSASKHGPHKKTRTHHKKRAYTRKGAH